MRKGLRIILLALALVAFGWLVWEAVGLLTGILGVERPEDFTATYHWSEGSLPPPLYWEYSIILGPVSRGEITVIPGHKDENVPHWTRTFLVKTGDLDHLYALMVENGVFDKTWNDVDTETVVGGMEWLEVTANGKQVSIPPRLRNGRALKEVYDAAKALVPQDTMAKLIAKRETYEEEH